MRQPVRSCVGCRNRFPQSALVRFVRRGEGWQADDGRVRAAGRGAYLCSQRCAARVAKNRRYAGLSAAGGAIEWNRRPALCAALGAVYDGRDTLEAEQSP